MIPAGAGGVAGKDVAAEIRALSKQLEELKSQLAWYQRDNEYRLDTLSMKRSWQTDFEANIDSSTPRKIDLYIPPETKAVQRVLLRLRLLEFESYTRVGFNEEGGPWAEFETTTAYWYNDRREQYEFLTEDDGAHDHNGEVSSDGTHSHAFYLNEHYHRGYIEAPPHDHPMLQGVYRGTKASNVRISINGQDVTSALGGPFNNDQDELDITEYIRPIGWNEIVFRIPSDTGRIRASLFVEIYLP